jgi:hypothetical protein
MILKNKTFPLQEDCGIESIQGKTSKASSTKNRTSTTRYKRTGQNRRGRNHFVPIDKRKEKKRSENNAKDSKPARKDH